MTAREECNHTISTHHNNSSSTRRRCRSNHHHIKGNTTSGGSSTTTSCPHSQSSHQHGILDIMLSSTSTAANQSSSSSSHSRRSSCSSTTTTTSVLSTASSLLSSSSSSSSSSSRRRVAFDHVDIIELAMELGDHPYCTNGPAVQTSGIVERRVLVDFQDYETQRSPLRRSAPELYLSSRDRMKLLHLDVSSRISSLPSSSSSSSYCCSNYRETEERILEVDQRVDALLQRMEILDQSIARQGRLRQQRQRARRATMVVSRTGRRHSCSSLLPSSSYLEASL